MEQQRVREEESESDLHGKMKEEKLEEQLRQLEAMMSGAGGLMGSFFPGVSYEDEEDSEEESDDGDEDEDEEGEGEEEEEEEEEKGEQFLPTVHSPTDSPPQKSSLVFTKQNKSDLPRPDETPQLPASTSEEAPSSPRKMPPVMRLPPKMSEADRLGCEALRLQNDPSTYTR